MLSKNLKICQNYKELPPKPTPILMQSAPPTSPDYQQLLKQIEVWAKELGFQQVGVSDTDLGKQELELKDWLAKGYHGEMEWMGAHGNKRSRPEELMPGTVRVISVRMDYLPADTDQIQILKSPDKAYVSRYALGRDYHKIDSQTPVNAGQENRGRSARGRAARLCRQRTGHGASSGRKGRSRLGG